MTKNEKEIFADIRNKYTPILTYFRLKEEIGGGSYTADQLKNLETLIDRELPLAVANAKEVAKLLKSFK